MTKLRVLVVDDEEGILKTMERYFQQRGDECRTARNGREALQLAQDNIFDLTLSDISMPGMDGVELVKRLKEIQPQTVCILMSGLGTRRDIIMALQIGVFDFVDKPIPELETFTMIIDRAAERSRLVRERDALLENLKQQNTKLEFSLYQLHEAFGQLRQQEAILQSDLVKAQRAQRQFLPAAFPRFEGLDVFGYYAPCELLGGDFFGYIPLKDGRVALYLADVAGHGVSAAMFTITLHELIRANVRGRSNEALFDAPERVLALMNDALVVEKFDSSILATMVFAVFEPGTGRVRVASAGHAPPLVVTADGQCTPVPVSGPVLGAKLTEPFRQAEVTLGPGDFMLLYSDGVTEARNAGGGDFTSDRLCQTLAPLRERPAADIGRALEDAVRRHLDGLVPNDDMTFVVASRTARAEAAASGASEDSIKIVMPDVVTRARADNRGQLWQAWLGQDDCIIRCDGLMTWQHAAALRDLVKTAKAKHCAGIAIYLAECESLDSTMLGLLLQVADDVVLHEPTSRVVAQLHEMGLLPQFTISHEPCPLPEAQMSVVPTEGGEACSELILSAHQALVELSSTNRERFKDVVDSLRNEQAAKDKARGETA